MPGSWLVHLPDSLSCIHFQAPAKHQKFVASVLGIPAHKIVSKVSSTATLTYHLLPAPGECLMGMPYRSEMFLRVWGCFR